MKYFCILLHSFLCIKENIKYLKNADLIFFNADKCKISIIEKYKN